MSSRRPHPATLTGWLVYVATAIAMLAEQAGRVTNDNRLELSVDPARFWLDNFTLWNPQVSLGEVRNQAYGYMFPQGAWFAGSDWLGVAPWVAERLWSLMVLVAAVEGARRVARAIGVAQWPALVSGLAFGLNVRLVAEVAVRSAEILPTAALPWVLLPIVHAQHGRLRPRTAALLSAAAFACGGAANATATIAGLPLVLIVLVWGLRTRRCRWSLPAWWAGWVALVSGWWVMALVMLGAYSAPFFDYVEDARTATAYAGPSASLRGASNWVNVIAVGDHAWWPAGLALTTDPWLVVATGLTAGLGLLGLVTLRSPFRTPLAWSAALGFVCLTVGLSASGASPLSAEVRSLLDGPLVVFRNVHKVDPIFRLPVAIGLGALTAEASRRFAQRASRRRALPSARASLVAVALVLVGAQPVFAGQTRTPGFDRIPAYWTAAADYLDAHRDGGRTWVIPGSGFGIETWGWTMEEPLGVLVDTPWVTRSQVPLVDAQTIRMLSAIESLIETGAGSPHLGDVLARLGISHVLVRHDLDPQVAEATASAVVSTAMARSGGVRRVEALGTAGVGIGVEIFDVLPPISPEVRVRPVADTVTVASGVADVVSALSEGLLTGNEAAVVRGDDGWDEPARIIGDAYRLRERNFGRVHDGYSAMMATRDPPRLDRLVTDYPGAPGATPAAVTYSGVRDLSASSSLGYADSLGETHPENGRFAAVDGDLGTSWRSAYYLEPLDAWLRIDFDSPRVLHTVTIRTPSFDPAVDTLTGVTLDTGSETVTAEVDAEGRATVDLGGIRTDQLVIRASAVVDPGADRPVAISEVEIPRFHPTRTLVLPDLPTASDVDWLFTATPETRSCDPTLFGPDCQLGRFRPSEEARGIDRTFTVPRDGTWQVTGQVVARSDDQSAELIRPLYGVQVVGSSVFTGDPTASWRMVNDGSDATAWLADPGDPEPRLAITYPRPQTVSRIRITPPPPPAVPPTTAILESHGERRIVDLRGVGTFAPVRTDQLGITFSNPSRQGHSIGVAELYLTPGSVQNPFDGNAAAGAFCGFGPKIEVDGGVHETRVDGLMGDVVSAGPMSLSTCDGPLHLSAGTHRLRVLSASQFQPVSLTVAQGSFPTGRNDRTWTRVSKQGDRIEGDLDSGGDALLSTTWNYNLGWVATVDGHTLTPQRVDGWAQGWRVPAGVAGRVEIHYGPQQSYALALGIGLGVAAIVLLLALITVLRTRLTEPSAYDEPVRRDRSRPASWVTRAALVAVAWLLGGPPLLAGAMLALVAAGRQRGRPILATLIVLAAVAVAGWQTATSVDALMPRWVDVLTSIGVGLVLTWLVTTRPPAEVER